jgi:hypothetical protein
MHRNGREFYHVYRNRWRWLGRLEEEDVALARYWQLECILSDAERKMDQAVECWTAPRRSKSGPREIKARRPPRPWPVRMHEKKGVLWHVYRNKWRRLGRVDDRAAAFRKYEELERELVDPHRTRRSARAAPYPVAATAAPGQCQEAPSRPSANVVVFPRRRPRCQQRGDYWTGGTRA